MSFVFMVIGTAAWFWKGYTEVGICLMLWGLWFETTSGSSAILARLIPSEESLKKAQDIISAFKRNSEK